MDWQREKDTWPHSDLSRFVEVEQTCWHLQRTGKGPCLLLLHGSGATTHSFEGLISELSNCFELLVPDLPGHGFSSKVNGKRASLRNVSAAIGQLLEAENFKPDFIVGHSAGAAIAVNMTLSGLAHPKGIISINGAFYPFPGLARQLFPAMAKLLFLNPFVPKVFSLTAGDTLRVKRLIKSTGSNLSEKQLDLYQRAFMSSGHVEGTLAMMANWELERMENLLKRLESPLLQLIGERDGTVDPAASYRTEKIVQHSERFGFEHAGHLVHEELPDAVAAQIAAFISRCATNPSSTVA